MALNSTLVKSTGVAALGGLLFGFDTAVNTAMEAIEETGSRLRQTIWGPVVKASAIIKGVQTGLEFFRSARHRRQPVEQPSEQQDEGMFI